MLIRVGANVKSRPCIKSGCFMETSFRRYLSDNVALCLTRIREHDGSEGSVNAFVCVNEHSSSGDISVVKTVSCEPLNMVLAVKDNICTEDLPTTSSSRMLSDFRPPYGATAVRLLKNAGAHVIGKTNCDEFGMGSFNTHSIYGSVINPYRRSRQGSTKPWTAREKRVAGGSSGGSAAAVASDMCTVALATDTGGSIRVPASFCGVVGLKPSYGLVSRYGVIAYADSLDCVGIMAKTVEEVRSAFNIIAEWDPKDSTSAPEDVRKNAHDACLRALETSVAGRRPEHDLKQLRVGVPQEYFLKELQPESLRSVSRALELLKARGAKIIPVSLTSTQYALSAYYVIASAEASSNLARYDGIRYGTRISPPPDIDCSTVANVYAITRSHGFGKEVQKRILLGTYALTADAFDNYFLQAQLVRKLVQNDFNQVFRAPNALSALGIADAPEEGVDVLIHPSTIGPAPRLFQATEAVAQRRLVFPNDPEDNTEDFVEGSDNRLNAYVQDVLSVPASLAGLPAISVPVKRAEQEGDDGWPLGVSVVGQWGHDAMVMAVAEVLESLQ